MTRPAASDAEVAETTYTAFASRGRGDGLADRAPETVPGRRRPARPGRGSPLPRDVHRLAWRCCRPRPATAATPSSNSHRDLKNGPLAHLPSGEFCRLAGSLHSGMTTRPASPASVSTPPLNGSRNPADNFPLESSSTSVWSITANAGVEHPAALLRELYLTTSRRHPSATSNENPSCSPVRGFLAQHSLQGTRKIRSLK